MNANFAMDTNDTCEQITYTVSEIAKLLGISQNKAYDLVKEGNFKSVRIGMSIRVSKKSFDKWLDEQEL